MIEKRIENFVTNIVKINKMIFKLKSSKMMDLGLKSIHVMALFYLKTKGSMTNASLCKLTLEDKSAMSKAISSLETKGLVTYNKGYNSKISLTSEGEEVANYILEQAKLAFDYVGSGIDEEKRAALYETLDIIIKNFEEYLK